MITSRQFYVEERDPQPLMPCRQPKPVEPAPKYAIIVRKDLGREGDIGRQVVEVQAVDEETGEIIATKQTRQFGTISPSSLITLENQIAEIAREQGYVAKYNNDKGRR